MSPRNFIALSAFRKLGDFQQHGVELGGLALVFDCIYHKIRSRANLTLKVLRVRPFQTSADAFSLTQDGNGSTSHNNSSQERIRIPKRRVGTGPPRVRDVRTTQALDVDSHQTQRCAFRPVCAESYEGFAQSSQRERFTLAR
jgi:hypothetical protein